MKCSKHTIKTLSNIGEVGHGIYPELTVNLVYRKLKIMSKVERVFVVSKSGKPLMPTKRLGKVRRLLKSGKAKVFRYEPFTIQSVYETTEYTQDVTVAVSAEYQTLGFSATTKTEELISGELKLLTGMSERLSECVMPRNNWRTRLRIARHALITEDGLKAG